MSVMEIRIGKKGSIAKGKQKGWYVTIQDDSLSTGGFLILQEPPHVSSEQKLQVFDDWVEDGESLKSYFDEAGWEIDWLE